MANQNVDFSSLLRAPLGESKRPEPLPVGDYPGVIKSREFGASQKQKTPYVRFQIAMTGFPDAVDPSEVEGVDLSKRTFRKDFYITPDALYRLDDFLKSCGAATGVMLEEAIESVIGATVLCSMEQYVKEGTDETGNSLGKVIGA
jgi:hypothetical protein